MLDKISEKIVNHRKLILLLATLLLIPSTIGMINIKINYNILDYLPKNLDSTKGEVVLEKNFKNTATNMLIIKTKNPYILSKIKEDIAAIPGVSKVIAKDDISPSTVPDFMISKNIKNIFESPNTSLMMVAFKDGASAPSTEKAIKELRKTMDNFHHRHWFAAMGAILKDTKDVMEEETPIYALIASILTFIVLAFLCKSSVIPLILLTNIGYAILYNLGTSFLQGEISYVTKALAAVLQMAVTMDYAIFLYHRYEEERKNYSTHEKAMQVAIKATIKSISGSSLTTIAGFLAMLVMDLGLGTDLGICMAKGVIFGLLTVCTLLPSLILILDGPIHKFQHRIFLPSFEKTSHFVIRHYKKLMVVFILLFIPALIGYNNVKIYYNIDKTLPQDMKSIISLNEMKKEYNRQVTHIILIDKNIKSTKIRTMINQIDKIKGVQNVLGIDKYIGSTVPTFILPDNIEKAFESKNHKLLIAQSQYRAASPEMTKQLSSINSIIKDYDKKAMITGEGAMTEDLIHISNHDFSVVSIVSIILVFIIVMFMLGSISLPIILVCAIELAIFINMAVSFYTGSSIPFVASIIIGTIQLGSTIDYSILMTTRYIEELQKGLDKFTAMKQTVKESAGAIFTSGMAFFAGTCGVGLYSNMKLVSAQCTLLARGAILSMLVIILLLPVLLLVFNNLIIKTTRSLKPLRNKIIKEASNEK